MYAIIEVKYRFSHIPIELIKINDEETLERRLAALKNNHQIVRIRVFYPMKTFVRVVSWLDVDAEN